MAPIRLFVTGITGDIGSSSINLLFQNPSARTRYTVRALICSQEKVERAIRPFGVEPVFGSLEDCDLLTEEASQADVVLHFAHADHVPAIKAILRGLEHRPHRHDAARKRPILIHTSGTGVLPDNVHGNYTNNIIYHNKDLDHLNSFPDNAHGNFTNNTIYYDNDLDHLNSLPDTQPNFDVDLEIFNPLLVDKIDFYIVAPPSIWGIDTGPGNSHSIQIPYHALFPIKNNQVMQTGKGINIWSKVHILDLARFYVALFERSLQEPDEGEVRPDWKPPPTTGDEYYFVEDGEYTYGDVAKVISKEFEAHGYIDSREVFKIDAANVFQYLDKESDGLIGGNSRARAVKARQLFGLKPEHFDFDGHIIDEVRHQLENHY
ncbi:hypothetical protein BGZ98_007270 [Dissophora globulifera]|nr:hypothetical protein BGZ98_007270 [Dissophora globulifera]